MRRADRLFHLVQLLRAQKSVTGAELAAQLRVSLRTVYRDIDDLRATGVPILGEAGVGFALQRGFELPPLTFEQEELEALLLGARMVRRFADAELAEAADRVMLKVEAVLPAALRERLRAALYVPGRVDLDRDELLGGQSRVPGADERLSRLRQAIAERRRVRLSYAREDGTSSARDISPVGLYFWGRVWSLGAHCSLRQGWRTFRVDRIEDLKLLKDPIPPEHSAEAYGEAMAAHSRAGERRGG